jgi:hypothetical protein
MRRRLRRRIAILLLGVLAFMQLGTAFASCLMDRSGAPMEAMEPCDGCGMSLAAARSDLQVSAFASLPIGVPALPPASNSATSERRVPAALGLVGPPPGAPPCRILLHSFLI